MSIHPVFADILKEMLAPMSELDIAMLALKDARQAEETAKAALKAKREEAERGYLTESTAAADATATRELGEAAVRALVVEAFLRTGNKNPHAKASVVESSKLKYDAAEAFAWAQDHKVAIALDAKAFEKIAKATPLPFVTTEVTPTARIATDLSDL